MQSTITLLKDSTNAGLEKSDSVYQLYYYAMYDNIYKPQLRIFSNLACKNAQISCDTFD